MVTFCTYRCIHKRQNTHKLTNKIIWCRGRVGVGQWWVGIWDGGRAVVGRAVVGRAVVGGIWDGGRAVMGGDLGWG